MKRVVEFLFGLPGGWVAAAVFAVSGLETAILVGTFLPGEVAIVLGGVVAAVGHAPLAAVLMASVAGPVAGDLAGYALGRRYGEAFVKKKLGTRRWNRAHAALTHRAAIHVAIARVIPFVRGVLPTTAGALGVKPLRFFGVDLPTAACWGAASSLAGYFVGRDYEKLFDWSKRLSLVLLFVFVASACWWWWSKRKKTKRRRVRV